MLNPYGHFDDNAREYVIERPDTPLPWINYLGCEEFFGLVSNCAGGYTFFRDAKMRRLTRYRYNNIPLDSNGRYLYVKDGEDVWNPSWKPRRVDLDHYECRHGQGYSKILGSRGGVRVETLFFVPIGETTEVWSVSVTNESEKPKSLKVWGFVEWCLWDAVDDNSNFQRNYSTGAVEVEPGTIYHVTDYRERRNHFAYFHCSAKTSGFDTSRNAFVGIHDGLDMPTVVRNGQCTNSVAHGWQPIGAHQIDIDLQPGETKRFHFLLGYAENPQDQKWEALGVANKAPFKAVAEKLGSSEQVDAAFAHLKAYWKNLLSTYECEVPNEHVQRMTNLWNQVQCMTTLNMSRSASYFESGIGRGMGYRDSNQDLLGVVHLQPERARQRLLDLAATQLSDGTCYHQYQPLTKQGNKDAGEGFNDDPLWLILSTYAYLAETGDTAVLQAKCGYADIAGSEATLFDHLELSLEYTRQHRGPHGLPLIGHADWNDCLNLNCFSTTPGESFQLAGDIGESSAESLMIAGQYCAATDKMAEIYELLSQTEKAVGIRTKGDEMRKAILAHGWDGEWFLRAYDAAGNKVGSNENPEGKIYIESQGWGVLGRVGIEDGKAQTAMNSVKTHLATKNGVMLQQPAYTTYRLELGEITSYPPGYKENAGIFTHNNTWIQCAEAILGNGNSAMDYYLSICPSKKEEQIDIYRCEPYVYSQMTAGADAATPGEAKNAWLTGTASWSFVAISQYILGVHPTVKGLRLDPCIPSDWKEYKVQRIYRGKTYKITFHNPSGVQKGVSKIVVNGKDLPGNLIPHDLDGKEFDVSVWLG